MDKSAPLDDEEGAPEYDPSDRLFGTVYSDTAEYVRVQFPVEIEDIQRGKWR